MASINGRWLHGRR